MWGKVHWPWHLWNICTMNGLFTTEPSRCIASMFCREPYSFLFYSLISEWGTIVCLYHVLYRRGSTGHGMQGRIQDFWKGGGSRRGYRIFHKHPPPLDIVRVTSSALRKFEKHPHSWTFTSTHPLDIARVTSSTFQGGGGAGWSPLSHTHTHTHTLDPPLRSILGLHAKKGGPTLGPMLKAYIVAQKGGGRTPWSPAPLDPPLGWWGHIYTPFSLTKNIKRRA